MNSVEIRKIVYQDSGGVRELGAYGLGFVIDMVE